jgi:hypothetical protein
MISSNMAIALTSNVVWRSVSLGIELDNIRNNKPAGPNKLGAMPINISAVVLRFTHRIALTGIISSKQINPIQPNDRLILLVMIILGCIDYLFYLST